MRWVLVLISFLVIVSVACSITASDNTDQQVQISIALTQTALARMQTELAGTQAVIAQEAANPTLPPEPAAPTSTLPPSTQPAEQQNAAEGEIQVSYDETIAQNVVAETIPAEPQGEFLEWSGNPEYVLLSISDPIGKIAIYPVDVYRAVSAFAQETLDELAFFLENKPAVAAWGCIPTTFISCDHQEMRANVNFLDFQNGSGVRSVAVYAFQDWAAINNENIEYSFEGLTQDGRYYIQAHFAIRNPVLPDSDWDIPNNAYSDTTGQVFQDYVVGKEDQLWAASENYQPPLSLLDALMGSLKVE